ncbi:MAG: undecaprenyldiphospho-muramoylpentapeptide beta-N-acetylglucosaminyltransferase [Bacteroidota bacterium]
MLKAENHIKKAIFSGGGTGGHIYPAIAVASELRSRFPDVDILFVGAKGKMEMQKVPDAGYKIIGLDIAGIQRRLTIKNLLVPFKLLASLFRAKKVLKDFKPDVVAGFGGYASGPLLRQAVKKNIPALLQEQNSYAGLTNKILAGNAEKVCVAYDGMEKYFPSEKIVKTGNPVRKDILDLSSKREEALSHFKLDPNKETLLILGGSLGARTINNSVLAHIETLKKSDIQVLWQTGKFYFQEMLDKTSDKDLQNIKILEFIKEMDLAYAAADIIISRAGALSISELCLVGKPVVFIPSPNVAEDHQTMNAKALTEKDAAIMIRDSEAEEQMIPKTLDLLQNDEEKNQMAQNIKKEGMPNATENIVNELIALVN